MVHRFLIIIFDLVSSGRLDQTALNSPVDGERVPIIHLHKACAHKNNTAIGMRTIQGDNYTSYVEKKSLLPDAKDTILVCY